MSFHLLRSRPLPGMHAVVQEFQHTVSGARHVHLANNDTELVFLVGFPTLPEAGDGRAHILEHLALCGSARYPVRDPFFAMLRRSMAHFMNAMTYADKTVYPFATTDHTDFFNLLDVYLDAAFFPRLDYLDFLQEGWRLAFDGDRLVYQGVVFNEMKGAFSDPVRALSSGIYARLLQGTTYAFESGGDPLEIPSLTHAALKEFHAIHYHPSQALFMTAGHIDPVAVQAVIEERVLHQFSDTMPRLLPTLAPAWPAPQAMTIDVPGREHGVQFAWLMGESADPDTYYSALLLDAGLLGNASAPLAHAMESAGYGRPSALNGVDAGGRQMVFHIGMDGLTKGQLGAARQHIWSALERAVRTGVPPSLLQAALRDMRFEQREISSDDMPDALQRLLDAMPYAMYGGDIMHGFDPSGTLDQFAERVADPEFFKRLVLQLLESDTRVDATVNPDPAYFQKRQKLEDERLAALQASLAPSDKGRILAEAARLLDRQRQPANNDVLPRMRLEDLNPLPRPAFPVPPATGGAIAASIASNGVSYARVMFDVSALDPAEWPWLQLYVNVSPELGVGNKTYEQADAWRHACVPFFDVNLHLVQTRDSAACLRIHVDFSAKGLREDNQAIAQVLLESVSAARFDEHERLAFLIDGMVQEIRNNLADEGDDYARLLATSPLSPLSHFEESVSGTASLPFYRSILEQSQTREGVGEISRKLAQVHKCILGCSVTVIAAGMEHDGQTLAKMLAFPGMATREKVSRTVEGGALSNAALHAPAQTNHCFCAWTVPGWMHQDAAALTVLAELLTNVVLHRALREEGGAYGGRADYNPVTGTFVMMSYRDPRLAATYDDFMHAISWVVEADLAASDIEGAIICAMQELDKPLSPYAELVQAWEQQQEGISEEMRQQYRHGILQCSQAQIKTVATTWLQNKPASRAAFVGDPAQELAGLSLMELAKAIM